MYLWIVIVSGCFAFFASAGIGANDAANAFATSVGSKALTIKQAVVLAAIPFTGYFGGGAYYLGWNIMGSIQFMFTGFLCLIVCFHGCCKKKKMVVSNSSGSNYNIHIDDDKENECLLKCAMWTVYTSMWIVNLVLICNDCMNSNGIPCIPF